MQRWCVPVRHHRGLEVDSSGRAVNVLLQVWQRVEDGSHLLCLPAVDIVYHVKGRTRELVLKGFKLIAVALDVLDGPAQMSGGGVG
jgi:hypothetical protein